MTIEFQAIEFETVPEALQWTDGGECGVAVRLGGKNYVMDRVEADRLAAAGVEFAFLHDHQMPDGSRRFVTVPVN